MDIATIRTPGLGDATHVFTHEGVSVLVDPQRDVDRFLEAVDEHGGSLALVLETHLHNDYVSGGPEAARRTGADLVLPAAAAPAYRSRPAFHMEDIDVGPFAVRPIHTPGHTPEHTSYLVLIDGEPYAVFSGGSLLVGAAGRPDLLGAERADTLARLQYLSVNRLADLPGSTLLLPTHGEGSFCTASLAGGQVTSTIGGEKATSPVLAFEDEEAFVAAQLDALQPYPTYYQHMGPANLYGYEERPPEAIPELTPAEVRELAGAALVDIRDRTRFAEGHIPGSVGLEMGDRVGVWAGWLLPFDASIVLIADRGQDVAEAAAQFVRIGIDDVRGVVFGVDEWAASGGELSSHRVVTLEEMVRAWEEGEVQQVLDVRAPNEWEAGSIPGALHRYLPDLRESIPGALSTDIPVWVVCATGFRATAAVRWLEEKGHTPIVLVGEGVPELLERLG